MTMIQGMVRAFLARCGRVFEDLTLRPIAQYGSAILRIGYGSLYLIFLLREFPNREELWGPNAAWTPSLDQQFAAHSAWYGWIRSWYTLLATNNDTRFELSYALALIICAAMVLGYRTRAASIGFMLVVTAFTGRDAFLGDGGDNVLVLMSIYLVFIASGQRLSLDSRRRRLAGPAASPARPSNQVLAEIAELRRRIVTLVHNAAILIVGFQMCVIYGAAALWKAQGSVWDNGTALYYVLHTQWFEVWPALSNEVSSHQTITAIVAYVTVFAQIGFPFAIFSKRLKYVLLVVLLGMHLSIAVMLGIPIFSAVMIVGDSVFLPDAFWLGAGRLLRQAPSFVRSLRKTGPGNGAAAAGSVEPVTADLLEGVGSAMEPTNI